MRERAGQIFKAVCLVLAALLLYDLVQVARRVNPLSHVTIPALPRLASDTNAPDGGKGMTNSAQAKSAKETNAPISDAGTNSIAAKTKKEKGTNLVSGDVAKEGATNIAAPLAPLAAAAKTEKTETNSPVVISATDTTNNPPGISATNPLPTIAAVGTNNSSVVSPSGTNLVSVDTNLPAVLTTNGTNVAGTNSARVKSKGTNSSPSKTSMAGMNANPSAMRGGGRPGAAELPPEIKARVDRIYESELFGMVMRPVPMGLLGIAGNSAILRAPSGQTGLVKEGDSLGEIKLLRIGINRVLVEQDGKKSELMIFDGYGGESLMPKDKETSK